MNKGNVKVSSRTIPMLLSMAVTKGYIESCYTEEHLQAANNLVDNFKRLFADENRLPVHETELQCALQNKRIQIEYLDNQQYFPHLL